ncbi:MAG: hypothetical protein AB7D43_05945 [Sulfurimonadaceae bacterium]
MCLMAWIFLVTTVVAFAMALLFRIALKELVRRMKEEKPSVLDALLEANRNYK